MAEAMQEDKFAWNIAQIQHVPTIDLETFLPYRGFNFLSTAVIDGIINSVELCFLLNFTSEVSTHDRLMQVNRIHLCQLTNHNNPQIRMFRFSNVKLYFN